MLFVTIGNLSKGIFLLKYLFMENFPLRVCSWDLENFPFNFDFFFPFSSNQHTPHALTCHQCISTHHMPGVTPDGMRWKIMLYFVIMITKIKLTLHIWWIKIFYFTFCVLLYALLIITYHVLFSLFL